MSGVSLGSLATWIDARVIQDLRRKRRADGEWQRERKLGTMETLWLMLAVALETGRTSLHDILRLATADLAIPWKVSVSGFCKARRRFSPPVPALPSWTVNPGTLPPPRAQSRHLA